MRKNAKRCRFLLLSFMGLAIFSCDTEKNVEHPDLNYFVKYYGGDGNQSGVDMALLNDGSFLLLGNYSETSSESEIYLMRVNAEGGVIWEKRLGRETLDNVVKAKDLEPTSDGNFVILSDFQKFFGDSTDIKLLKVSPDGVRLDSTRAFGTPANDFGRSVTLLNDGGFIVSGTTEFTSTFLLVNNPDPDLGDIFNYRFDQNLDADPVWKPINVGFGAHLDVAVKTVQVADTLFYVFGYTNSVITGGLNPNERLGLFYFERNASGTFDSPFYPGNVVNVNDTEIKYVQPVAPALGTGFVVLGTSQNSIGVSEIFLAKMRSSLTFQGPLANDATLYTTIPLGRNLRAVSVAGSVTSPLGYLVLGDEIRSTLSSKSNIWLTKIDQSAGVLWSATFGSEAEDDTGAAVMELPDGKIIILGTMGLADNQSKMALIKVNPNGQLLK